MPISHFSAEGYKAFAQRVSVELRQLTFFFGSNAVGKSALLRLIPSLPSSNEFQSSYADFPDLLGWFSKYSTRPEMIFEFTWINEEIVRYKFTVRSLPDLRLTLITEFEIVHSELGLFAAACTFEQLPEQLEYDIRHNDTTFRARVGFSGVVPFIKFDKSYVRYFDVGFSLRNLMQSINKCAWLTSLRAVPPRMTTPSGIKRRLGNSGEFVVDVLSAHSENSPLFQDVSNWLEKITGNKIELVRGAFREKDLVSAVVTPKNVEASSVRVDICDTGDGISQVLPIVVAGCMVRAGLYGKAPLVALEHPELHLHPSAQDDLGEFLCEISSSTNHPNIMVETHSETLVLTVQLAIAQGRLSPNNVIVHLVTGHGEGSKVNSFTFDEKGRPQSDYLPHGLFSETSEQARRLIQARLNK